MPPFVDQNFDFFNYFENLCSFLHEFKWIFEYSNVEYVGRNVLDKIPACWIDDFESCTLEELNNIPNGLIKVSFRL
jgi:hypothetical protein